MNAEWVLGLAGVIIMLLLSAIGWFLNRYADSFDALKESVTTSQIEVSGKITELFDYRNSCEKHLHVVDNRLNSHSTKLDEHGKAIEILKERTAKKGGKS